MRNTICAPWCRNIRSISAAGPRRAAAARESLDGHLDLPYGDHPKQTLDYFPAAENAAPILAFIHGGYGRRWTRPTSAVWLRPGWSAGWLRLDELPLAPQAGIPQMLDSCREAVLWLWHNAYALGQTAAASSSPGIRRAGHLATLLLATDWTAWARCRPISSRARAAVSGVYDLEPIGCPTRNPMLSSSGDRTGDQPAPRAPAAGRAPSVAVGGAETTEFLRQQDESPRPGAAGGRATYRPPGLNHYETWTAWPMRRARSSPGWRRLDGADGDRSQAVPEVGETGRIRAAIRGRSGASVSRGRRLKKDPAGR